ncbi:hypothetical protein I547_5131 [Mycobacterium kansasii 824]|nr:hypothetical protein I547_5131 [Mycobacterium kansasii 824]OOK82835.1 hypothetical protein BZL30_0011 [Mycobacterium kansasii]
MCSALAAAVNAAGRVVTKDMCVSLESEPAHQPATWLCPG